MGPLARLASIHARHKRIVTGALLIGLLTLVAKIFVAGREIAVASRYGVSSTVDAYQLAITATTWVPTMLASVMTVVVVPRLVALQRDDSADRRDFIAELNGSALILGIVVAGITWLAAPVAAEMLASDINPLTLRLTTEMTAQMAPVALLMILSAYASARLQSRERYGYSITEAVPALSIALFVAFSSSRSGPWALIVGTLIGYLFQIALLGVLLKRGDPPLGGTSLRHGSAEWRGLRGSFVLMILGQLLIATSIPVDQGFAARLGEGQVATLGYASRIITLFSGLGTVVVGRALLPALSEAVAEGDVLLGRRQAIQWSALLGGGAAIGAAMFWFVAPYFVQLLFQRGAFSSDASAEVASVLRMGLLQLPFYFAGIALVQWYAATARFKAFVAITAGAITVKVTLNAFLTPVWGVEGIMASTAGMYMFTLIMLVTLLGRVKPARGLSPGELSG